jgi:hypothetical protein
MKGRHTIFLTIVNTLVYEAIDLIPHRSCVLLFMLSRLPLQEEIADDLTFSSS